MNTAKPFKIKKTAVVLALGLVGWALCGGIMYAGMAFTSMENALIIHAIGAPVVFGIQLHHTIKNRDHICFRGCFHGCFPGRASHRKELCHVCQPFGDVGPLGLALYINLSDGFICNEAN